MIRAKPRASRRSGLDETREAEVRTGAYDISDPNGLILPGVVIGSAVVGYAIFRTIVGGFVGLLFGTGAAYLLAVRAGGQGS